MMATPTPTITPDTPAAPSPTQHAISAERAGRSLRAWVLLTVVVVLGLWIDLASKQWAFANVAGFPVVIDRQEVLTISREESPGAIQRLIPPHTSRQVIPNVLDFTLVLNPGAVFGIGPGKRVFFMVFTGLALVGGIVLFTRVTRRGDHAAHIGIGLLIAGGLGNLYDRLTFGCVRDFLHPLPGVRWPWGISMPWGGREVWPYVSNVADLFLLIGIAILAVYLWRTEPGQSKGAQEGAATGGKA